MDFCLKITAVLNKFPLKIFKGQSQESSGDEGIDYNLGSIFVEGFADIRFKKVKIQINKILEYEFHCKHTYFFV